MLSNEEVILMSGRRVLVTGASSGIGAATARLLAAQGWDVVAAARRLERLDALAAEQSGITPFAVDITSDDAVARLVEYLSETGGLDAVINNAGGAFGLDPIATAPISDWQHMYELNVIGTLRVIQGVLPLLRVSGGGVGAKPDNPRPADIVVITSTAALAPYVNGAGYVAAKHAERMLATTLRWELAGEPIRVIQIEPGAVETAEFSLNRFDGDAAKAAAVYQGYVPLTAADIAEAIAWTLSRPAHVNIDHLTIRPIAQVNNWTTARH